MSSEKELSKTEWQVMNVCWRLGQATARQVHEADDELRSKDYRTVKTLLDRIAAKGYLRTERLGPLLLFEPAVSKRPTHRAALGAFVDRVLGKDVSPLVLHLAESGDLSESEERVLRELLERLEEE
ncbi:MAG: BlaI/MecI/CopY family transcriptional regulator [Acidobacteriota bacterium]